MERSTYAAFGVLEMIEEGIVRLLQTTPAVSAIAPVAGFFAELPKDNPLPSWTYITVSQAITSGLTFADGLRTRRIQLDCYGFLAADAIALAKAIDKVLLGYTGTLPDADHTFVNVILLEDQMDFFDDARRSYRRMLEYEIVYAQS